MLNLQVDSTGCAKNNFSCPVWTVGVSAGGKPNPACSEQYDACWKLGPALVPGSEHGVNGWNDWVIQWKGSPVSSEGYLSIWRNGKLALPKVAQMLFCVPAENPKGLVPKVILAHANFQ